ncbi:MAG TPA: hypothetical protein VI296_01025 [Candidatus Dormibacteraeota bacterium]
MPAAHRRWYEDAHPVAPMVEVATRRVEQSPKHRLLLISVLVALVVAVVLGMVSFGDQGVPEDVVLTLLVAIPFGLAALVTMYLVRRNS